MKNYKTQQKISTGLIIFFTILIIILVSGCSTTVPVKTKFPQVPEKLLTICPELEKLNNEVKLSDISKTVTANYTTYYECAAKHDAFIEWYQVQKNIYESIK